MESRNSDSGSRPGGRYMLYAVGEITLVVLGILIALQINNWNESKKNRAFEITMLEEVERALITDSDHFVQMADGMAQLIELTYFFVQYIHEGGRYHDSLVSRMFRLNAGVNENYNRGPYEAIKAAGIDKISDDSLRNTLINFYDFQLPSQIDMISHYHRNHQRDIDMLVTFLNDPMIIEDSNGPLLVQYFSNDILSSPEFLTLLRSIQFRSSRVYRTIQELLPELNSMAERIREEIDG